MIKQLRIVVDILQYLYKTIQKQIVLKKIFSIWYLISTTYFCRQIQQKGQWDTTLTTAYGCESYCTFWKNEKRWQGGIWRLVSSVISHPLQFCPQVYRWQWRGWEHCAGCNALSMGKQTDDRSAEHPVLSLYISTESVSHRIEPQDDSEKSTRGHTDKNQHIRICHSGHWLDEWTGTTTWSGFGRNAFWISGALRDEQVPEQELQRNRRYNEHLAQNCSIPHITSFERVTNSSSRLSISRKETSKLFVTQVTEPSLAVSCNLDYVIFIDIHYSDADIEEIISAGRGRAPPLEILIINDLQITPWPPSDYCKKWCNLVT